MSLEKAIKHKKEKREPYRGAKSVDKMCRNHGGCKWCEENRQHKNKRRNQKEEEPKICLTCDHCIYIGEGDYICDADETPKIVMEEHCPNDNYWWCNGTEWEEK